MLFKDLHKGNVVYVLNTDELKLSNGKVVNVGVPYFDMPSQVPNMNMNMNASRVVDVTIEINGATNTYKIPENLSVTFANKMLLSTDKSAVVNEIESIKSICNDVVNNYERSLEKIKICDNLLSDLNPEFKEKKENEEKLANMQSEISEIKQMILKLNEKKIL